MTMEQYIPKTAVLAEIENLLDKGKYHEEYDCAYRDGNNGALYALKGKLDALEVKEMQEESVSEDLEEACEQLAENARKHKAESLAQKYINYIFRRHNIDPESREGQLIYYAYIHGMNQCLDQLKL